MRGTSLLLILQRKDQFGFFMRVGANLRIIIVVGELGPTGSSPPIASLTVRGQARLNRRRPAAHRHLVTRYTSNPNHSCKAVCQRNKLWASEYSVSAVESPVRKSTGYGVTLQPTA